MSPHTHIKTVAVHICMHRLYRAAAQLVRLFRGKASARAVGGHIMSAEVGNFQQLL